MDRGMIVLKIVYILMPVVIVMAFAWAPAAEIIGDASRCLYFHVPIAWVSFLAFVLSGIFSIVYLFDKKKRFYQLEGKAYNSSVIGMVFTVLTTITGSMWAKINWGTYWNWDPREISIVYLMLIYIAYFSLRSALSKNDNIEKISTVYLIFAMIAAPFFIFILPRIYISLHPNPVINADKKIFLDGSMRITLITSVISFTLLYFYILNLMNRILVIEKEVEEKYNED